MDQSQWAKAAEVLEVSDDLEYIGAVYKWASEFALDMDDIEEVFRKAEESFKGEFSSDESYAEHVAEEHFSEKMDQIQKIAESTEYWIPSLPIKFDFEDFVLHLQNTQGWNFSEYDAYYFGEPA